MVSCMEPKLGAVSDGLTRGSTRVRSDRLAPSCHRRYEFKEITLRQVMRPTQKASPAPLSLPQAQSGSEPGVARQAKPPRALAPSRPRALAPSPLARPRSPSRPAQHFVGSSVLSYSGARSAQGRELTAPCACKPCGHGARVFDTALSFFLCRHRPAGPRAASEALSAQQAGQGLRHVPTDAQLARHDQPAQDAGTRTATRARCSHHTHLGHKEEADFSRSGGWDCAGASSGWCWCRRLFPAVTGAGTDTIRFCPISVVKSWATAIAGRLSLSPPTTAPRHAPLSPRAQTRACPAHDRRA